MPRGDGTGPMGMGRMTGRGAGFAGGFGCGFRRMFHATGLPGWARFGYPVYAGATADTSDEREILNDQAEFLEKQLQQVKRRLSRLKGGEE